ncbi:hypothetical protein [Rhizobium tumorigenes]|uniref:hypothetical protein n=1 Tax=Rhizobium tumorigenes TaxID=2041385 RepID=UPI00241E9584|nr:hypothetical protein [Rhizobium tumorigenes]WFS02212.1 hypothetical protein PR016_06255 [Rhizobium tumorigenes]
MAHDKLRLRRYNSVTLSSNRQIHFFNYATDNTAAEMLTAGYFNASRAALTVGSMIDAVIDVDGTMDNVRCRVTAVPADGTSNVTVVYDAPAAGS